MSLGWAIISLIKNKFRDVRDARPTTTSTKTCDERVQAEIADYHILNQS